MRIAIDGAFGTGKTTLANKVGKSICLKRIVDIERVIAKEINFDFNNHTKEEFEKFQNLLIEKQEDLENEMGSFITDSSFIIQSAYNGREYNGKKYDLNFYLPPEIEIKKDGIRNEEKEYQKQIDEKIKEIYKKYNIKYIEITGNIQERVEKILLHINMILFYNEEKNAKK